MGYTKDLWTRPDTDPDGKPVRIRSARWGKGKRWLACWIDPDGAEKSRAFKTQAAADKYWQSMKTTRNEAITVTRMQERNCSTNSGSAGWSPVSLIRPLPYGMSQLTDCM